MRARLLLLASIVVLAGCSSSPSAGGRLPAQGAPVDKSKPVHVPLDSPCPTQAPEFVINHLAGLRDTLVPLAVDGTPISGAHVCVWNGLNATPALGLSHDVP